MVYLCVPEHAISVACCSFEHETPLFLTDGRFDAFVSRVATWYSLRHFLDSGKGEMVTASLLLTQRVISHHSLLCVLFVVLIIVPFVLSCKEVPVQTQFDLCFIQMVPQFVVEKHFHHAITIAYLRIKNGKKGRCFELQR